MSGALPTSPVFSAVNFESQWQTFVSEAQSRRMQARAFGGHRWKFTARYSAMTRAEFAPIYAFIQSQNGRYGTFTVKIPDLNSPRGAGGGTPLVAGGSQTGNTLNIDGATATAGWLLAGDIFTINGDTKVYMLTEDADTNGSPEGSATLTFIPELVTSPSDNAAITIDNCDFTVRLNNDIQSYRARPGVFYTYELDLIETI